MRKTLLIAMFVVFGMGISNTNAQEMKLGATVGLPVGDMDDWLSFGFGIDFAVLWEVGDDFYVGGATGYHHFIGEEWTLFGITYPAVDFQYIPLAATARYFVADNLYLGADLGYGIGVGDTSGGDFYYRPKAGYNFGNVGVNLSYGGLDNFSFIGLAIEFGL